MAVEKGAATTVKDQVAITTALTKIGYELEAGDSAKRLPKPEGRTGAYDGGLVAGLTEGSLEWTTPP